MKTLAVCGAGIAVFFVVLLVPGGPGSAAEADISNYLRAVERICATGVTPEANRAYEEAVAAADREREVEEIVRYGVTGVALPGKKRIQSNFWGPQPPERAYAQCVQAR